MIRSSLLCCFLLIVSVWDHANAVVNRLTDEASILDTYNKCITANRSSLICDPNGILADSVRKDLEQRLIELQTQTPCNCPNRQDCYAQTDGSQVNAAYRPLLIAMYSYTLDNATINSIVSDPRFRSGTCENGVLFIYGAVTGTVDVVQGNVTDTYVPPPMVASLVSGATNRLQQDDTAQPGLEYLIAGYMSNLQNEEGASGQSEYLRSSTSTDYRDVLIGCLVAGFIVLLCVIILAIIFCHTCGKAMQPAPPPIVGMLPPLGGSKYQKFDDNLYYVSEAPPSLIYAPPSEEVLLRRSPSIPPGLPPPLPPLLLTPSPSVLDDQGRMIPRHQSDTQREVQSLGFYLDEETASIKAEESQNGEEPEILTYEEEQQSAAATAIPHVRNTSRPSLPKH